jgi:hypothetical protein
LVSIDEALFRRDPERAILRVRMRRHAMPEPDPNADDETTKKKRLDEELDEELEGTFPASDPPEVLRREK